MKNNIPDYITKIEGHGILNINFKEQQIQLEIQEGERLFEGVLWDQPAIRAPFITSRICGICPTAHNLASLKAVENALGIEPDEVAINFRKLLLANQIIFSHLLHLFFFVLPDYYNVKNSFELARRWPAEFHIVLNLKRISDKILTLVGGRPIHPTKTTLGGFLSYPSKDELVSLRQEIIDVLDEAQDLINIFIELEYPQILRQTEYLCLDNENEYSFYEGNIVSSQDDKFPPEDYRDEITEIIKPYSTAKFGQRRDKRINVGALARISLHHQHLNIVAERYFEKIKNRGFSAKTHNPFNNNLAQSIEILHFLEESIKIIDKLLDLSWPNKQEKINIQNPQKLTWGIAAIEAPRGTLYHAYEIGKNGKIINADILTPTVQNLTSIEKDAEELLKMTGDKKQAIKELEMLVRAYDPCITCSVH